MDSFVWSENFLTGLPEVDRQHKQLVSIINRFGSLLANDEITYSDINELFNELTDYTRYHFTEEEELMVHAGMDIQHRTRHAKIHQGFLQEVTNLYSGVSPGNLDSAKHMLDFLIHWLVYHILGEDQKMARQISAIRSGVSTDDVYGSQEQGKDKATEPLLNALTVLFEQVSQRNKELIQLNRSLEEKVAQRTKELSEANLHLEELSLTDSLTGLSNRRHAMRQLIALWDESVQADLPLVCIMLDADHFKEVNDAFGHAAGDVVLTELARTLRHAVRTDDIVCRLGGDEFFIICPNTDLEGGMYVAEITQRKVSELRVPTGDGHWRGSISVGAAARTPEMKNHEELIKAADNGVYAAKQAGKNCVRLGRYHAYPVNP